MLPSPNLVSLESSDEVSAGNALLADVHLSGVLLLVDGDGHLRVVLRRPVLDAPVLLDHLARLQVGELPHDVPVQQAELPASVGLHGDLVLREGLHQLRIGQHLVKLIGGAFEGVRQPSVWKELMEPPSVSFDGLIMSLANSSRSARMYLDNCSRIAFSPLLRIRFLRRSSFEPDVSSETSTVISSALFSSLRFGISSLPLISSAWPLTLPFQLHLITHS
ncbi:hypothetical protein TYRP_002422 [Tyrophagus putrescentiae]|nr:hypothetical protein TYRP_002422 [Tyrophagus putrescentiae]